MILPAEPSRRPGMAKGDRVVIEERDGGVSSTTARERLRRAQAIAEKYAQPGKALVNAFLTDKRARAERGGRHVSSCVIDTSAMIAFILNERGSDVTEQWRDGRATVSTVTLEKLTTPLLCEGFDPVGDGETVGSLGVEVRDHTRSLADAAAQLYFSAKSFRLSHGDLSCLAFAAEIGVPAVTAARETALAVADLDTRVEQVG